MRSPACQTTERMDIQSPMKRFFDIAMSLAGLILLLIPFLIMATMIKLSFKESVLFKQPRPGKCGRLFYLYKFRTMNEKKDKDGNLLPDEIRLTGLGKTLRKWSLDEWPELLNVLKGDMSLVGPRPLLSKYLVRYTADQRRRHEVRPGITGWAQVNGRNAITWEDKFKYDVWYVDHWNLLLDFKIIIMTIGKVLRGEGINQPGYATAEEFMGSPPEDR